MVKGNGPSSVPRSKAIGVVQRQPLIARLVTGGWVIDDPNPPPLIVVGTRGSSQVYRTPECPTRFTLPSKVKPQSDASALSCRTKPGVASARAVEAVDEAIKAVNAARQSGLASVERRNAALGSLNCGKK